MQVFKLFFKIAKTKALSIAIFLGIFLLILNFASFGGGETEFRTSKMALTVFDKDNTVASKSLMEFLAKDNEIIEYEDDKDKLIDALYITSTNYVITINEGFSEKLGKGETDGLFTTRYLHDSYTNKLADSTLDNYVRTVRAYMAGGKDLEAAIVSAEAALSEKTDVKFESYGKTEIKSDTASFFNFLPYALLCIIVSVLCPVIVAMNKEEVGFRTRCSSIKLSAVSSQTALASAIFVVAIWFALLAFGILKNGGMYTGTMWYGVLNTVAFSLVSMALAILFAELNVSENALSFLTQVLGLGMAFLCGMFVPVEFLPASVIAVGRFLPLYWYVRANNMIFGLASEAMSVSTVMLCLGIQVLFAVVIYAVSLIVKKQKR